MATGSDSPMMYAGMDPRTQLNRYLFDELVLPDEEDAARVSAAWPFELPSVSLTDAAAHAAGGANATGSDR
jgi:hypothetical protein